MGVVVVLLVGCGSSPLRTELLVAPEAKRRSVERMLARHNLCVHERDLVERSETYRHCSGRYTSGAEPASTAVVVRYDDDWEMITLQRFERHVTRGEARVRFEELVSARTAQNGSPSEEAKQYYVNPPPHPANWLVWYGPEQRSIISLALFDVEGIGPDLVEDIVVLAGR